ncbi:MAG: isoquinoline 1-oxidoreductase [Flavobacteriaceae bacterium]|nr:MAG: isoquinoline 1-oxidoreductase [Flavobacteriaceae bacterium]
MSTSKPIEFSRRGFLRTSSLASGGLLIGFNLFTACKPNVKPPIDLASLNYDDFNAYIKIAKNGAVTIFSPNPEIGQGVKTSMPMVIAEELDVSWDNVFVKQGVSDAKNYPFQFAGGSNSLRLGWDNLRKTGATAKQMLINAAAVKWGVDPSECTSKEGIITNAKGETLGYGDVVTEAAALEVPEEVTLKDPADFTIIGTSRGIVDIESITTGKPLYGLDYKAEGMVYAVMVKPTAFGQKLDTFDASEAKALSGVVDVISYDGNVVVLAKDTWTAFKAQKLVKVVWIQDTNLESTADHDKLLNGLLDGNDLTTQRKDGDVNKAFAEADEILERNYEAPFLPHNCMEPMNFYANVTPDRIHLVGPIQTPNGTAKSIAEMLERDIEDVHLEMTRMGGGFGRRLYGDFAMNAAKISSVANLPIKLVYTREDDIMSGMFRPPTKYRFKAGIKDGKITAYHLKEASVNSNMYGLIPHFFPAGAIDNYQVDTANYQSNISTAAWRAPYTNFLAFAEQTFFDELAELMEVDRIQLRLDLLQNVKGHSDENIKYSPERMEECIHMAVEKSNWGKQPEGVYQGFVNYYCHNTHVAEVADVVVEDGKPVVKKITCVVDCGIVINPSGAKNQIEGGIIDGLGHAMYGDFSFKNGEPSATNFQNYRLIRMKEIPEIETHFIKNDIPPTGLGEPALPPAAGAVANALHALNGKRFYSQPFINNPEGLSVPKKEILG